LHVFQHSNRSEKILHSSSKSASISHVSFSSMKDHDLKIYIDWHIQSKSQKRKILRFALNQLSEQKYDLQTIQTLKNTENRAFWQELNILSSIEIQLVRDVSKFDREMTSRRRMSSSSSIFFFKELLNETNCSRMREWQFVCLLRICNLRLLDRLLRIQCHFRKDQLKIKMTTKQNVRETWICSMTKKK
jgi:hypothetical protein